MGLGNGDAAAIPGEVAPRSVRLAARWLVVCSAAVLVSIALLGVKASVAALDHEPGLLVDFEIYLDQARRLWQPHPTLAPNWLYPPLAAVLLLGFALISDGTAHTLWMIIQLLLCVQLAVLCARQLHGLSPVERGLCGASLVIAALPVVSCVKWGQLSVLILLLSVSAFERVGFTSASLLAAAAGLKLYPVMYALRHVVRLELRALARFALCLVLLAVVVPVLLIGTKITADMFMNVFANAARFSATQLPGSFTLGGWFERWFGQGLVRSGPPMPLLFFVPAAIRDALTWAVGLALAAVTLQRQRRSPHDDLGSVVALMLCTPLLLKPAWVHYFVALPLGHAVVLGRPAVRRSQLALAGTSFLLSFGALLLLLWRPDLYPLVRWSSVVTVSALCCLIALW